MSTTSPGFVPTGTTPKLPGWCPTLGTIGVSQPSVDGKLAAMLYGRFSDIVSSALVGDARGGVMPGDGVSMDSVGSSSSPSSGLSTRFSGTIDVPNFRDPAALAVRSFRGELAAESFSPVVCSPDSALSYGRWFGRGGSSVSGAALFLFVPFCCGCDVGERMSLGSRLLGAGSEELLPAGSKHVRERTSRDSGRRQNPVGFRFPNVGTPDQRRHMLSYTRPYSGLSLGLC